MTSNTFKDQEVPTKYREAHLSKIHPDISAVIMKACEDKVFTKGLFIFGSVGLGKTFTGYAIYNHIRELKLPVKFIKSSRIVEAAKNCYYTGGYSEDVFENKEILKDVQSFKGVLIIDDMGSEKLTEGSIATYFACLDHRYEYEYPTIYTSNYSLEELTERLGERIVSRIYESSHVYQLEGISKRT